MKVYCLILTCAMVVIGSSAFSQVPTGPGVIVTGTIPRVVSSVPLNGDQKVGTNTKKVTITFDQVMDTATFYWPIPTNDSSFPKVTAEPFWTDGNRTVVLPVSLQSNRTYRVTLNVGNQAFRSAQGIPLQSGVISFRTTSGGSSVAKPANVGVTPAGVQGITGTPRVPGQGATVGGSSSGSGSSSRSSGSSSRVSGRNQVVRNTPIR